MDNDNDKKVSKTPARYKLYDKLKIRASLRTMNIIVYTIVGLLIAAIILGVILK